MIGGASGTSGAGGAMPISGCNHRAQDLCVNVSFGLAAPCAGCSCVLPTFAAIICPTRTPEFPKSERGKILSSTAPPVLPLWPVLMQFGRAQERTRKFCAKLEHFSVSVNVALSALTIFRIF